MSHDEHDVDPLAPARGCLNGILLGALLWVVIGFLIWLVVSR